MYTQLFRHIFRVRIFCTKCNLNCPIRPQTCRNLWKNINPKLIWHRLPAGPGKVDRGKKSFISTYLTCVHCTLLNWRKKNCNVSLVIPFWGGLMMTCKVFNQIINAIWYLIYTVILKHWIRLPCLRRHAGRVLSISKRSRLFLACSAFLQWRLLDDPFSLQAHPKGVQKAHYPSFHIIWFHNNLYSSSCFIFLCHVETREAETILSVPT